MIERFLRHVLPQAGFYCLATPKNGWFVHKVVNNIKDLVTLSVANDKEQKETFFAVGTLKQPVVVKEIEVWDDDLQANVKKQKREYRTHANMNEFKALILDIDCNGEKIYEYPDQQTGLAALKQFITDSGLPKPTLVNSGRGLHVYWTFTEAISSEEWFDLSLKASAVYKHFGLKVDPRRVKDKSSVLRVVGTHNYKDLENPKPVQVVGWGEHTDVAAIEAILDKNIAFYNIQLQPKFEPKAATELFKMFEGVGSNLEQDKIDIELVFAKCKQMARIREIGGTVGYSLRASACSIIKQSENPDYLVIEHDDPNPDTVQAQTEAMLRDSITNNPHTCESFEAANPDGCRGCQERVKSPVVLGRAKTFTALPEAAKTDPKPVEVAPTDRIPPPNPYVCGENGVMVYVPDDEGNGSHHEQIYEYALYPVERVWDYREKGEVVKTRVHLPHDGIRDFLIPAKDVTDIRALSKILAHNGVIAQNNEKNTILVNYMFNYIRELQKNRKATHNYAQLGWQEDSSMFVLPDITYNQDGTEEACGVSDSLNAITKHFKKKGTLEGWREVIDIYAQPGYEAWAFGHLTAYGAVLFEFTEYDGAIVSMVGETSSGKSTVLKTINSIFGHPKDLLSVAADTYLSRMNRIGELKSICCTYDEVTDIQADELSALCYSISDGRAKHRLQQNGKAQDNHTTWKTLMACSTNKSLHDILGSRGANNGPQAMRVFEYRLDRQNLMASGEAKKHFAKLSENYGHAGEIFVKYIVENQAKVKALIAEIDDKFEHAAAVPIEERYWSAIVATCIAGGMIAKELGLNKFDMDKVFEWAVDQVKFMRINVRDIKRDGKSLIVSFLNTNVGSTLVVGGTGERNFKHYIPEGGEPRGSLLIRSEIDKGLAYIPKDVIRKYIIQEGADFSAIKRELMNSGILMDVSVNKTLTADSNLNKSGSMLCWLINTNHKDMAGAVMSVVAGTTEKSRVDKSSTA